METSGKWKFKILLIKEIDVYETKLVIIINPVIVAVLFACLFTALVMNIQQKKIANTIDSFIISALAEHRCYCEYSGRFSNCARNFNYSPEIGLAYLAKVLLVKKTESRKYILKKRYDFYNYWMSKQWVENQNVSVTAMITSKTNIKMSYRYNITS